MTLGQRTSYEQLPNAREGLSKLAESEKWPKFAEAIRNPQRFIQVKEDLQAFEDAMNSGDAFRALIILAKALYGNHAGEVKKAPQANEPIPEPVKAVRETLGPAYGEDGKFNLEKAKMIANRALPQDYPEVSTPPQDGGEFDLLKAKKIADDALPEDLPPPPDGIARG